MTICKVITVDVRRIAEQLGILEPFEKENRRQAGLARQDNKDTKDSKDSKKKEPAVHKEKEGRKKEEDE